MISKDSYIKLERERRKLGRMIHNAVRSGASIAVNEEILQQSRKVDALIMEIFFIEDPEEHGRRA